MDWRVTVTYPSKPEKLVVLVGSETLTLEHLRDCILATQAEADTLKTQGFDIRTMTIREAIRALPIELVVPASYALHARGVEVDAETRCPF